MPKSERRITPPKAKATKPPGKPLLMFFLGIEKNIMQRLRPSIHIRQPGESKRLWTAKGSHSSLGSVSPSGFRSYKTYITRLWCGSSYLVQSIMLLNPYHQSWRTQKKKEDILQNAKVLMPSPFTIYEVAIQTGVLAQFSQALKR